MANYRLEGDRKALFQVKKMGIRYVDFNVDYSIMKKSESQTAFTFFYSVSALHLLQEAKSVGALFLLLVNEFHDIHALWKS